MNYNESGRIGQVIEVNSERVVIEVSKDISNYNIIYNGNMSRIGQVGSFIKIITGLYLLYGIVESFASSIQAGNITIDKKILYVAVLGYQTPSGEFERGAKVTPSIDDTAYILGEEDIKVIFKSNVQFPIKIGDNFFSSRLPAYINLNEFILKHSFIVGSTGSGKSNTVAYLLDNITQAYPSSRVLVIDIHGEYMKYLGDNAVEYSVSSTDKKLVIPYWMLDFESLCKLCGIPYGNGIISTVTDDFREEVLKLKKDFIIESPYKNRINLNDIDVNSPIPFSINKIWYEFYTRGYGTYSHTDKKKENLAYLTDTEGKNLIGDAEKLIKPQFMPHTPNNTVPYKSNEAYLRGAADKLFKTIMNENFEFMFGEDDFINGKENINKLICSWIDDEKQITVLNLSGIPYQVTDLVVGTISNLLFDTIYYSQKINKPAEGRPILLCYEEAHKYLNTMYTNGYSVNAVERIMKEGRKFGVGAMIISQRPTEISNTIISQVSTFIALRLTNSEDQNRVIGFAPNNFSIFLKTLSSLGAGEAFVIGESMKIPMKIKIPLLESVKKMESDKRIGAWKEERKQDPDYSETIERWMQK